MATFLTTNDQRKLISFQMLSMLMRNYILPSLLFWEFQK